MGVWTRLAFAAVVVATLSASSAQLPAAKSQGLILGRVIDMTSARGVAGAVVTLAAGSSRDAAASEGPDAGRDVRVATDPDGYFVFASLSAGRYAIAATAPGYSSGGYGQVRPDGTGRRPIDLADGQSVGVVRIPLWRLGSISGVVRDGVGEPVVGAPVRLVRLAGDAPAIVSRNTDDRGSYRFDVTAGDYVVGIGSSTTTVPSHVLEDYAAAQSAGPNAANAYASALAAAGAPYPPSAGAWIDGFIVATRGPLPIKSIGDGSGAVLYAYASSYYPGVRAAARAAPIHVEAGQTRSDIDLTLAMEPAFRVSGTVAGPRGPVPNLGVSLLATDSIDAATNGFAADVWQSTTDTQGAFSLVGVPAGEYVLRLLQRPVRSPDSARTVSIASGNGDVVTSSTTPPLSTASAAPTLWAIQPVTVGDRDVDGVSVTLRPGIRVSGTVEYRGASPPPSADALRAVAISLRPVSGTSAALMGVGDPGRVDGRFAFAMPELPPGAFVVSVSGLPAPWQLDSAMIGAVDAADTPVTLDHAVSDAVIVLADQGTRVVGRLRRSNEDAGVAAAVIVFPADRVFWPAPGRATRRCQVVFPDDGDAFAIDGLPEGRYWLAAIPAADGVSCSTAQGLERLSASATPLMLRRGQTATLTEEIAIK